MHISRNHINNNLNTARSVNFGSVYKIDAKDFQFLKTMSNCHLDGLMQKFKANSGKKIAEQVGQQIQLQNPSANILKQIKDVALDAVNCVRGKLQGKLPDNEILLAIEHNGALETRAAEKGKEASQRAVSGFFENGERFLKEALEEVKKEGGAKLADCQISKPCDKEFQQVCNKVTDKFYGYLNQNIVPENSYYNTRDERTLVKFFTSLIAALFLFTDFHNNSVRDGKVGPDTDKEAREKFIQEMKENTGETAAQFITLGSFEKFTNNSKIGAPIINTLISLFLRITSRLSSHKPLTRIEIKEKPKIQISSLEEFADAAKNQKEINIFTPTIEKKPKEKKKHLLSFKNIMLACGASIAGGFAIRYGRPAVKKFFKETVAQSDIYKTTLNKLKSQEWFNNLEKTIKEIPQKYKKSVVGETWVSKKELEDFYKTLEESDMPKAAAYFKNKLDAAFSATKRIVDGEEKMLLGEYEKMTHLPFTKIEMSKRELYKATLTPFRIVKDLISYPYKAVAKILEGLKVIKPVKTKSFKLADKLQVENIYRDMERFLADPKNAKLSAAELSKKYNAHMMRNWADTLNTISRSNVDNTDIGKLTQLFGTVTSLYFAMTDDFNRTARETGNKELAQEDARRRGVNKMFRIITQLSFMDVFNHTFKVSYGKSLLGATAISMACTFATEAFSHFLTGMPLKKMDKEELEEYQQKKKDGVLKGYYESIDKLVK